MPPNNTNSRKSNELIQINLELDERHHPASKKCQSKEETSTRCGNWQRTGIVSSKSQTNMKTDSDKWEDKVPPRNKSVSSLVDELLSDIYSKMEPKRRTSATTCDLSWQDSDNGKCFRSQKRSWQYWKSKDISTLKFEKIRLEKLITEEGNKLIKHLKRKNFLILKREAHYDVITAYIQAVSPKTREDTKMKFSLTPGAETGFSQWLDAMKMVAQLPGGMPSEFRTKLWLQLSEKHLNDQNVDWAKAEAVIFNEWTNPDDEELGVQIVKDLHRTGCSLFCGEQEHNQALLKRVLLAYARWNKNVGYCQGFNMLAALILQVMDKDEKNAVKVMIYLIEGVLPESYFANNLRGLSVDMAVFRDLLRLRLPKLSKHLEALQHDTNSGTSYEPPLTNVFTMQWFLTLFSNCLPQQTVLRVWDLVFLYGNEVLLRTALAIWGILQDRVITVESADEFYSIMGVVTREMLEFGLMDANTLVKMIAMVDPFPNELQELREKYLYNISPWTQSVQSAAKKGIRLFYSDPDDQDDTEDEDKIALATAYGVFRRRESTSRELQVSGPTLDISVLKQQYAKLRQRQRQAHVIITAACSSNLPGNLASGPSVSVNHLLMGKSALVNKGRRIGPPEGSIPPPSNKKNEGKDLKKPKIVVSGETVDWKDAEKKKTLKSGNKKESRKESERNEKKTKNEENVGNTNHDRMKVTQKSVEESLRAKEMSSGSSSSSTELCDDEFNRMSDFESEDNSECFSYRLREMSPKPPRFSSPETVSPCSPKPETKLSENGGCDKDNLAEIKNFAINLVNEIEEEVQKSERLKKLKEKEPEVITKKFDNTISLLDMDNQLLGDNILKLDPEVPIQENVIKTRGEETLKEEPEAREKIRRKSDLGLSVIRENLEMLHKFSQKGSGKTANRSFEMDLEPEEKTTPTKMKWSSSFQSEKDGRNKQILDFPPLFEQEVQKSPKTEKKEPLRLNQNVFVEKAISPIVDKSSKAVKVNKEVNTEITFGVEEVEISTTKPKVRTEEEATAFAGGERLRGEDECPVLETSRKSRESLFRDEIKQKIETSKSDWELKMRKIAELETTTRETLNEIQARSAHRKSLHRSLDRTTKRTYFENTSPPRSTFLPKIELESSNSTEEETNYRKLKTSARSFDAITSRTEKLLGNSEFNRSTDESSAKRSLSPEFEVWKSRESKFKNLSEESNIDWKYERGSSSRKYEFYSSPTSPETRSRTSVKYPDLLTSRKYWMEDEDFIKITQNGSKTSVDLINKKYSPEHRKQETEVECFSSKSSFNPFPTRSASRPKELGVRLGLYPTSPEPHSKKS